MMDGPTARRFFSSTVLAPHVLTEMIVAATSAAIAGSPRIRSGKAYSRASLAAPIRLLAETLQSAPVWLRRDHLMSAAEQDPVQQALSEPAMGAGEKLVDVACAQCGAVYIPGRQVRIGIAITMNGISASSSRRCDEGCRT